ncbi:MAG: DEAD/DEAH box helicase family protein, partial [Patescibacteria group bacterium]
MHEKNWPKTVEARRRRVSSYLKEFGVASRALEEAKSEFEHRAYQLEAWANIWEARQKGKKSALLHLATGLGKTSVAVFDVMKFRKEYADNDNERPPKVLFVCHQNNILEQAQERFAEFIPEASSQYFQTKQDKLPEADLTFGTFQSLRNELDTFPPDYFDYIIYDEAHHSQADTFSDVVEHFTPEFQLALTATPDRLDDKDITDHFGAPVYSKTLPEAMSEGWLAQVDYHIVFDDAVKEAIE